MKQNDWRPDVLEGFESRVVEQPADSYGEVRCTVVRMLSGSDGCRRAVVYVHGFSDYFFEADMARRFVAEGYNFYAVDLRRYGRSIVPGQKPFMVRSLDEYFPDIQAAIDTAKADGAGEIVLKGHSTGGLTATLFMQTCADPAVKALILNSPFLAWNLRSRAKRLTMRLIAAAGRLLPDVTVPSGGTIDYHRSLSSRMEGEWDFSAEWKPDIMPDVDAGWVRAIELGQRQAARGGVEVPVLLMHSDKSAWHGDGARAYSCSDGVLDVGKIAAAGLKIGRYVDEATIKDGLHDLVLSPPAVREYVFRLIFSWLSLKRL